MIDSIGAMPNKQKHGIVPFSDVYRRYFLTGTSLIGAGTIGIGSFSGLVAAKDIHVPDDESTIQDAVDAANDGDTIVVASGGTYQERVTIDKSVTVRGKLGGNDPGAGQDAPILEGDSQPGKAFTIIGGTSDVIIEGFKIQHYSPDPNDRGHGVFSWNSAGTNNITIRDNTFLDSGFSGVSTGSDGDGVHDGWSIVNNEFEDITSIPITLVNTKNSLIENNDVKGSKDKPDTEDHTRIPGPNTDAGIRVEASSSSGSLSIGSIKIRNNTIKGPFDLAGIWVHSFARFGDPDDIRLFDVLIEQNEISDVEGDEFEGRGIYLDATEKDVTRMDGITVKNNSLTNNEVGIWGGLRGQNEIIALKNTLSNNLTGVKIPEDDRDLEAGDMEIKLNKIYDNSDWGVLNNGVEILDAFVNWWGDDSGPSGDVEDPVTGNLADGEGDKVSESVRFHPWLRRPVPPEKEEEDDG